jgi:hypothetical protein
MTHALPKHERELLTTFMFGYALEGWLGIAQRNP